MVSAMGFVHTLKHLGLDILGKVLVRLAHGVGYRGLEQCLGFGVF